MKFKKILSVTAVVVVSFLFVGVAYANSLFFATTAKTNNATTSPTFLVRGTTFATTTLPIYDSFEISGTNQINTSQPQPAQTVALEVQFTASSTASVLQWYYEYADREIIDCGAFPSSCDWYSDNLISENRLSTSTTIDVSTPYTQKWTFASSTVGGVAAGVSNNRDTKVFNVRVPTRYVRVVFYCPSASNCGVWAKWVPIKQDVH